VKKRRAIKVIRLGGELEIGRKNEIRESLASSGDAAAVLLDLGTVTYADSIALTELLRFCAEAARNDRPVALVVQTPQFARLVQYAGLANAFKIFSESAAAMEYLGECARES
jgi:anti-anti-sigma factor